MQKMTFSFHLSAEKYLQYYQGSAKFVVVTTDDGRTLRFPANNLQKFVTKDGISGHFEMVFSDENKIVSFRRLWKYTDI